MTEPESMDALSVARAAVEAFLAGDLDGLRQWVDPDFEWTFLDPSSPNPEPATCRGIAELEVGLGRWARLGLRSELEEIAANGDRVMVVLHAPGLDNFRARNANDRNFHVLTVQNGRVQSMRACRDRDEARQRAGLAGEDATGA